MQKTRYKFSKLNQNKSLFQLLSSKGTIKLEQMNKIRRDIPTKIKINSDINKNINNNNQMPKLSKRKSSSIDIDNNLIKRREIKSPKIIENKYIFYKSNSQNRIKFKSIEAEKSKKENININLPRIEDKKNNERENLELSKSVFNGKDHVLELGVSMIQKGYIPLFMKLNDYKPLLFWTKEGITLERLVKLYIQKNPEIDEELMDDIRLYHDQRLLDINVPIKYFNFRPFSIIMNRIGNL